MLNIIQGSVPKDESKIKGKSARYDVIGYDKKRKPFLFRFPCAELEVPKRWLLNKHAGLEHEQLRACT